MFSPAHTTLQHHWIELSGKWYWACDVNVNGGICPIVPPQSSDGTVRAGWVYCYEILTGVVLGNIHWNVSISPPLLGYVIPAV